VDWSSSDRGDEATVRAYFRHAEELAFGLVADESGGNMERKSINPWAWPIKLGFDQAQLITGQRRMLVCSGQDSVDANGNAQHPQDMGAQVELSLDNLQTLLTAAGMSFANIVRLNVYTTDMDQLLRQFGRISKRFGNADARYTTSLLGVARLPLPELLVMLEATAVD
jgi:enamine deaminase RidA (YjgF/YER057c/UK114 family)